MSYVEQIQKALDYIESHLTEECPLAEIAHHAGFSNWHFQRLFSSLTGESLKSYVRKRRLSTAAQDLRKTRLRILDIALKYRFESQESFTRSFKERFQVTPGNYRQTQYPPVLNQRLQITKDYLEHLTGDISMQPEIIELEAFDVIGLSSRFISILGEQPNNFEVIPALWDQFNDLRHQLDHIKPGISIGLCLCEEIENQRQDEMVYLAGAILIDSSISEEALAHNLKHKHIDAHQYAKFTHIGSLNKLRHTMHYIYHAWLPKSGYILGASPEIEWYDHRFMPDSDESAFDILIPIRNV